MLENLKMSAPDPLLGIMESYKRDANPQKIDLGVGVYRDESGNTPVLQAVKQAETRLLKEQTSKSYLGSGGDIEFTHALSQLVLGDMFKLMEEGRICALQTPGGCGALRVAAELLVKARPQATIWVSDPTWANHVPLLGNAGLNIETYPYYDYSTKSLRFEAMLEVLSKAPKGDLVLLHACCHNPCGADLSEAQWQELVQLLVSRELIPFVDMAYQGFGRGLDEDAYGLRLVMSQVPEAVFAVSCSKNFGLYRDRVGLVGFLNQSSAGADVTASNLVQIVRGIYSMPPDHGAAVVASILRDDSLRSLWQQELSAMRKRILSMRTTFAQQMEEAGFGDRFRFVEREFGMFSFLGISEEQVASLAKDYGIYMVGSSRMNIAGLSASNLDYFCQSLSAVLGR